MAGDEPPFLPVGTEVSAKYRGAFCEAKVKKIVRSVKCKIYIKETLSSILVTDDSIVKGVLKVGSVVEVKYGESGQILQGVITKLTDCSMYTVVFDDGDEKTLRRTQCCLKGEKHFIESETLDNLPLSHPEHFGTPVIHNKTKRRVNRHSVGNDDDIEDSSSDESLPKRACYRGRNQELVGKVMQVEIGDKKKQLVPVLVILPDAHNVELKTKDHLLVKSFKDGKFHTFHRKELKEFSKDLVSKNEDKSLKSALEKAVAYFDNQDLPSSWERDELLGTDEEEPSDEDESSDDEPNEEKDRFVAQLYKFMDDRGTPINKAPCIGNKDLNLYRLFKILQNLGGYNKVTNHLKWRLVYNKMGLPPSNTASHQIKTAYKKYLHAFEDFYRKLGSTMGTISRPGRSRHNSGRGMVAFRGQVKDDAKKDDKDSKDGDREDKKSDSMDSDVEEESPSKIVKSPPRRERISRADMVNKEEKEKADNIKEMRRGDKKEEEIVKRSPMRKDDAKKEESAKKVKILKKEEKKKDSEDEKDEDKQKKVIRRRSMRKDEGKKDEKKDEGKKDDLKKEEEEEKETSSEIGKRSEKDNKAKSKTAEKKEKKEEMETKQRKREESRERNEDKKEETTVKKEKAKNTKKDVKKEKKNEEEEKEAEKTEKKVSKKDAKKQKVEEDKEKGQKKKGKVEEDDSVEAEEEEENESKSVHHKELPLGTRLQVRYGRGKNQKVYDAKIMEIQRDSGQLQYLVHYAGWNNRYDEWIRPERIVIILNKPTSDSANKKKNKESPPKSPKGQVSKPTRKSLPNQTPPHTTPQPRATSDVRPVKKSPCTTPSSTPGSVTKQTKMRPTRSNSIEFKVVDTLPAKARRSRRSSGLTETSDIISQESDSEVDEDTETEVEKEDVESLKPANKVEEEEDNHIEDIAEKSPEMPEIVKDLGNFYEECDIEKSNESFKDEDTDSANESNILPVELDLLNRAAEVKRDDELNNLKETNAEVSSEIKKADNKSKVDVIVEKKTEAACSESVDNTDKDKQESITPEEEEQSELSKSGKTEAIVEKVSDSIDKQESQNKEKPVVEEKVEVPVKVDPPPLDDKYVFKDEDEDFLLSDLTSDKDWRERFTKEKEKEKSDVESEKKTKGRKKEWSKVEKKETLDDRYVFRDEDEDFLLSNLTTDKDWRERFAKDKDKEKSDGESEKKTKGRKKEWSRAEKKETPVKEKKDTKRGRPSFNEKKASEQNVGKQEDVTDEPPQKKAKETRIEIEDKQAEIKEKVESRSNTATGDSSDKNQEEVKKEENEVEKKKVKKKVKKKGETDTTTVTQDQKKEGKKEVGKLGGKGLKGDKVANKTKSRKNKDSSDGEKDTSSSDQGASEMCEEKVIETDCSLTLLASSAESAIANDISSVIKTDLCANESTELLSHSYSAKEYSSSKDTSNCIEGSESKEESSDSKNSAKEQTSNTSALYVNTPPTTPEHDTDMPSSSLSSSSHEHSQDSNLSIKMTDIHVATDRQYGSDFPEGNASPSSHDGSVGSGNVAGSESSNNEAQETTSHGKRRKESEEVLPPKRKKRGKSKTEHKNSKIAGSDSDDYAPDRRFSPEPGSASPSKVSVTHRSNSPRAPRYHLNLEEGKYLEGERRISFLMEKIQEIRKIYMNLKSEVACIDRRRKRCQRKDKDSFHCSSNGNMEGETTR